MDRVAAAPRGPWALRACAAKAPTPRSNLEAISPETSRCTSGNRLSKTGGTSVGERLTTPGQPSASCPRPAEAALKVDAAHAQLCLASSHPPRRLPPPRGRGVSHRDRKRLSGSWPFHLRARAPVSQRHRSSCSSGGAVEAEVPTIRDLHHE